MGKDSDLMQRINKEYSKLSKSQKAIANYVTDSLDEAVFLTAAKMGKVCNVSESTVVRFAMRLGYNGFPEFQAALEEMVHNKLSRNRGRLSEANLEDDSTLASVLSADIEKIKKTLKDIDKSAFDNAIEVLLSARRIYVVGLRSCAPLASFLAFYLGMIFDDVVLLATTNTSELFEQMINISEKDAVVGISFPRYSMRTLKAMEFANSRRAKVITITDSVNSPMNLYSSCNLLARSGMISVVDSIVAPMSVINALIVTLCMRRQDDVVRKMDEIERIWQDYQFYENDELSQIGDSMRIHYNDIKEE